MSSKKTLAEFFRHVDVQRPAVILPDDGLTTTYRSLIEQIEATAGQLQQAGLEPGQTLAIVLPNGLEYLVAFLAATRARLVAAPLNPAYKPDELRFYLEDSGARAVLTGLEPHPVGEVAQARGLKCFQVARDKSG
ncbi:MAG TPA: AMP-binding protein, partial [Gemmataceae bacterium]|nr:AMP-binding protein [Gemmataceae bacterium]